MAAKKKKIWFGFLEAGAKRSPVLRDASLETGNPKTVYLFNLMKEKILEYRLDIVEFKLRELEAEELTLIPELRKAYDRVREDFEPRGAVTRKPVIRVKPAPPVDDFPEFDAVDEDGFNEISPPPLDNDDDGTAAYLFD